MKLSIKINYIKNIVKCYSIIIINIYFYINLYKLSYLYKISRIYNTIIRINTNQFSVKTHTYILKQIQSSLSIKFKLKT